MKKRLLFIMLILACISVLLPVQALADGEGYLSFDSVQYPEGNELYQNIISTADGGYAIAMTAGRDSKHGSLKKYNAAGSLVFSYEYVLPNPIFCIGQAYCPVEQTADAGYLLAADGGTLVKLDASGKEMWKKQLGSVSDIYEICLSSGGRALLSICEAQSKANKILCVDENANVLWQKNRRDLGAADSNAKTIIKPATTTDGNFAVILNDTDKSIAVRLDTNGNITWKSNLYNYGEYGLRYFYEIMGTSDGGLLLAGSHFYKLSAENKQQWSTNSCFGSYGEETLHSVIETGDGYAGVGTAASISLKPKDVVYNYTDTLLAFCDNNGDLKYGDAFFEGMESLRKIVRVGGNRYIALATAWNDYSDLAEKDTALMYFNTSASRPRTGWEQVGNDWYLRIDGLRVRGWQQRGLEWYWFGADGKMATGWIREADSPWYYLKANGSRAVGFEKIKGHWYYFFRGGTVATGWIKDRDHWYYLSPDSSSWGWMQTGWLKDGGRWYYLKPSGAMAIGWLKVDGSWYYFTPSGAMFEDGWMQWNGNWYYLYRHSGAMATGRVSIGGRVNIFAASGKWLGYVR